MGAALQELVHPADGEEHARLRNFASQDLDVFCAAFERMRRLRKSALVDCHLNWKIAVSVILRKISTKITRRNTKILAREIHCARPLGARDALPLRLAPLRVLLA